MHDNTSDCFIFGQWPLFHLLGLLSPLPFLSLRGAKEGNDPLRQDILNIAKISAR